MTREEILDERWLPIKGYEGLYEISSLGRIKSFPVKHRTWERISSGYKKTNGYIGVTLCKNGKTQAFFVHRLVADAFVPNPNKESFTEVNHKDEDKSNNRANNLEWCDTLYNNTYGGRLERVQESHIKSLSCRARKRIAQYTKDGTLVAIHESIRAANRSLGKSEKSTSIYQSLIHRNNQYYAYGYKWVLL